jgi:glycosyltransferase involved in cell wall biosynthesis
MRAAAGGHRRPKADIHPFKKRSETPNMRVCLETSAIRPPMTGIGYYVLLLAQHLANEASDIEFFSFDSVAVRPMTPASLAVHGKEATNVGGLMTKAVALARKSNTARLIYRQVRAHRFRRALSAFDLFHALNFVPPMETTSPVLPLVHDLSFQRLPHTHPAERVAFLRERLKTINSYPFINTLSRFSASEIADVYGYPIERIGVTHPGVNERMYREPEPKALAEVAAMGLHDRSFFLTVGTVEPRKNHKVLVEAYVGMPAAFRRRFPLVIVGASGWGSLQVSGQEELVRDGSIRFLGYAAEDVVHALYARARALLFPTLYEGFGIPVAEAMACGLQPVVSDIPVMHEVAGEAGIFVDPQDPLAWRALLVEIAEARDRLQPRERLMQRAGHFTWQSTAKKTVELYRRFQ